MTTIQTSWLGEDRYVDDDTQFVSKLLDKYPAASTNPGLFFYLACKERVRGLAQLPEATQMELKAYFRDLESYRRRRQEYRLRDEQKQRGLLT